MSDKKFMAGAGTSEILFDNAMFPASGCFGVHDYPHFRILILENDIRIAIAAVELVNIPAHGIAMCRKIISQTTGIDQEHIWIAITHPASTPHFPPPPYDKGPNLEQRAQMYLDALRDAVLEASRQSVDTMREAVAGFTCAACGAVRNRDIETPFGWWIGEDGSAFGPSNDHLTVLRLNDLSGAPIAFLMNYGLKSCALDLSGEKDGKRLMTSDVSGEACRLMEEEFKVPVLYCMGAGGNQVPVKQAFFDVVLEDGTTQHVDLGVEYGYQCIAEVGDMIYQCARELAHTVNCTITSPKIDSIATTFQWKEKAAMPQKITKTAEYQETGEMIDIPVDVVRFGEAAFVMAKSEVCCVTELQLRDRSPFEWTLFFTMVNGEMKYMVDQLSYDRVTWQALRSKPMPGAAEKYVDVAVDMMEALKS